MSVTLFLPTFKPTLYHFRLIALANKDPRADAMFDTPSELIRAAFGPEADRKKRQSVPTPDARSMLAARLWRLKVTARPASQKRRERLHPDVVARVRGMDLVGHQRARHPSRFVHELRVDIDPDDLGMRVGEAL